MAFKRGKPKTGGRKKGVVNKKARHDKDRVDWVLGLLEETLEDDIAAMTPPERGKLFATLLEYREPKLARTEHTGRVVTENYNVDLTQEDMKKINETLENDC